MKKLLIISILNLLFVIQLKAQTPQIVVVRPNGVSSVFTTWDLAYAAAVDGDNIYLPGGTFTVLDPINKRLNIIGAGSNIDSSSTTGISKLNSITILTGGAGGTIEGVYFIPNGCGNGSINFGQDGNSSTMSIFTISNCNLDQGIRFINLCTNFLIKNNVIGAFGCNNASSLSGSLANSIISNNIITNRLIISGIANLEVNNNIFFFIHPFVYLQLAYNSNYRNNIMLTGTTTVGDSNFFNNVNVSPYGSNNFLVYNVNEGFQDIFINPGIGSQGYIYYYEVNNNYRIKATSLCHNSGTDGTDRGIYGGAFPWKDGQIPSNPHIFFKQIAPQTALDGKINVHVKVRTNN